MFQLTDAETISKRDWLEHNIVKAQKEVINTTLICEYLDRVIHDKRNPFEFAVTEEFMKQFNNMELQRDYVILALSILKDMQARLKDKPSKEHNKGEHLEVIRGGNE